MRAADRAHSENPQTLEMVTMVSSIIDPTRSSRVSSAPMSRGSAPRPSALGGLRVGLLENTKRNAAALLDALGQGMAASEGEMSFVRRTKEQFALPLSEEMILELRDSCDVVVIGVGDCGSCSASAVADGVLLESRGIPTAVICTDAFEGTSRAMAALQGDPGYDFLMTSHPVANLSGDQVVERAGTLVDAVLSRLRVHEPVGASR